MKHKIGTTLQSFVVRCLLSRVTLALLTLWALNGNGYWFIMDPYVIKAIPKASLDRLDHDHVPPKKVVFNS